MTTKEYIISKFSPSICRYSYLHRGFRNKKLQSVKKYTENDFGKRLHFGNANNDWSDVFVD